jgi:hypothetical protein
LDRGLAIGALLGWAERFPLSGLELDHRNVVGVHPLAHRAPEPVADLFEHRR